MPLVLEKPNYPPHVCLVCGVGERRKWWVDLQLPIDNYFNPVTAGAVYVCNECWDSIAVETAKQAQILLLGSEAWSGNNFVPPTYDNEEPLQSELTVKEKLDGGLTTTGLSLGSHEGTDTSATEDDRPIERDDSTPEPDSTDEQTEPVREFREHFGAKP